ncbi:trp operon leader peptide [Streptomyces hoynatensis]|uniref:Trp operon leader peptide n=1 Tax=Streptomyces hoynatensis TaxID=1141874 RepID=A0A3A9Z578_9ACTN|nr:trp operon leader peptide [Streptomyces hoynatensis]
MFAQHLSSWWWTAFPAAH